MKSPARWTIAFFMANLLPVGPGSMARADDSKTRSVAEATFQEAGKLMVDGKLDEACPKFEAVVSLMPRKVGALMALAECLHKQGKLASAWARYRSTAVIAGEAQDKRAKEAETTAAALEPLLTKVTVRVPSDMRTWPSLVVQLDDIVLVAAQWGVEIPVDPGPHVIRATALNKVAWSVAVEAKQPGALPVDVAVLEEAPAAPAPASSAASLPASVSSVGRAASPQLPDAIPSRKPGLGAQQVAGIVAGAIGLAGAGIGLGLLVTGISGAQGLTAGPEYDEAGRIYTAGWVAVGIGAGVAVGATVLFFTAPSTPSSPSTSTSIIRGPGSRRACAGPNPGVRLAVGLGPSGISVQGSF